MVESLYVEVLQIITRLGPRGLLRVIWTAEFAGEASGLDDMVLHAGGR